ncbi:MAG: hypothetical protein JWP38_3745 [Herbaspirillum sp.]|nr:hypothetical protein [Herbaspirillum sp.]
MSTTVIDALLVTLGLDSSGFKKGSDDASKAQKKLGDQAAQTAKAVEQQEKKLADAQAKRAKELEARSKNIALGLNKIRNEALGLLAIFTAGVGLKSFIQNTITSAASLDRMSSNLGMSAKDLSMWQLANERAGGSLEGMTSQIKTASSDIAAMKLGMGPSAALQASFRFGVNASDLKDSNTLLMKQADILKSVFDVDPTKAMEMAKMMGISEDSFNLLKQGSAAVKEQRLAQRALAEEMARNAPAAEEFRKKWNDLNHEFEALALKYMPTVITYLQKFADWLISIAPNIEAFIAKLDTAVGSIGGWKTVLIALVGLKVLSFAGDLIALAASIIKVGDALGVVSKFGAVIKLLGPLALALHSDDLNAGEDDELKKRRAGMLGYDSKGGLLKGSESAQSDAGGDLNDRQKYLASRLKMDGYSNAQSAGIIGSLMQESQLNPNAVNSKSGAIGIGQWLGSRKQDFLKKYGHGLEKSTFEEQTDFMLWELRNTEKRSGDLLRRAPTPESAAQLHAQEYERPGIAEANIERRKANAASIATTLGQAAATATANMPSGATAAARAQNGGGSSTSTTDIKVGAINVQTQATDATGIAKSIGSAVTKYGFVSQANTGLA